MHTTTQTLDTASAPVSVPVSDRMLFVRKFLRHGTRVASFSPSSASLAAAMCRHVRSDRPQTIVELGAGTGAVTATACRKMHPGSRLIALEIDPDFCAILQQRFPAATVVCANIAYLDATLELLNIQNIDVVLSGLPTPSLPRPLVTSMLKCLSKRAENGWISQLTVMPYVYRGMYRKLFEHVDFDLVIKNLPPGGVYHCRQFRPIAD